MKTRNNPFLRILLAASPSLLPSLLHAADFTWTQSTAATQTWTTAANWSGSTEFVTGSANTLTFFSDTTTALANGNNNITDSVPAALAMNTLTLNGKGAAATGATNVTLATSASTWTLGDGATSTVNLNGVNGSQLLNYTVAAQLALDQTTTTFTGSGNAFFNFTGAIGGVSNGITKSGTSTLTLTGANTYTGTTTLNGGIIVANVADVPATSSALGNGGDITFTGGTLQYASASAGTDYSDRIKNSSSAVTLDTNVQTVTLAGVIDSTNTGGVTKLGTGILNLTGPNGFTGATTINAGVLTFGKASALYGGSASNWTTTNLVVNTGGTLGLNVGAPSDDFTTGDVTTILTNLGGLGGSLASGGLKAGSNIGFDTTNAFDTVVVANNIKNSTGAVGGAIGVMKLGSGTLDLTGVSATAADNYTGATTIDNGTLTLTPGANLTGGLTFGALVAGGTNTGTLDLSVGSASFAGGLTVQTNSTTPNFISIGTGQTLTTGGAVIIGGNAGITSGVNPRSYLTVDGLGSWTHTASGGTFRVGNNVSGTTAQRAANAVLDLSGLTQFTADLRSSGTGGGTFVVGDASAGATGTGVTATLSADNTIFSNAIQVTAGSGAPGANRLALGSGPNVFNANTLTVGNSQRADDRLNFADSTGTFRLRALTGTAGVNVGNHDKNSSGNRTAILDLSGHSSDMVINTLAIGNTGGSLNGGKDHVATFTFDSGTMTVTNARVGRRQNSAGITAAGSITANLNIGNGTTNLTNASTLSSTFIIGWNEDAEGTSVGNVNIAGSDTTVNFTSAANNLVIGQSSNGNATGTLNISGGDTTITRGITLGNKTAGAGTVSGSISLTGGTLTLGTASITTTADTTSTLTLDGGSLNMNGRSIGGVGGPLITNLNLQTGTLSNVGEINNGAGLTKNTAGTLTLAGANTYTGATNVSVGTLALGGGSSHTSPITVDSGATLGFTSGTTTTSTSTVTFSGATANVSVSGTPAAGTLLTTTVPLGITGTPVLDPAIAMAGYTLAIEDGGTTLKLKASGANTYSTWAALQSPPVTGGENGDDDNDGVTNLVEYALIDGGERGVFSGNTITFTKRGAPYGGDVTYSIEESTDLGVTDDWTVVSGGGYVNNATTISYTLTPGTPVRNFARLKVVTP